MLCGPKIISNLKCTLNMHHITQRRVSWVAQLIKNLPAMQKTPVRFLGWEDPQIRIGYPLQYFWASMVAQTVKNPPAMRETWV